MLEDPTFPFIVSLCMLTLNSKKEKEALTRMLVTVFCSSDMLQQLLSVIISVEVDRCRGTTDVDREINSLDCKCSRVLCSARCYLPTRPQRI